MTDCFQLNGYFYLSASGKQSDFLDFEDHEEGELAFVNNKLKFPCGLVIPQNNIKSIKYRFIDNLHLIEIGSQAGNFFYFNVPNENKAKHQEYAENLKSAILTATELEKPKKPNAAAQLEPASNGIQNPTDNVKAAVGVGKAVFNILDGFNNNE